MVDLAKMRADGSIGALFSTEDKKAYEVDLGKALVDLAHWKWMPGMLATCGLRADETMDADDWSGNIS